MRLECARIDVKVKFLSHACLFQAYGSLKSVWESVCWAYKLYRSASARQSTFFSVIIKLAFVQGLDYLHSRPSSHPSLRTNLEQTVREQTLFLPRWKWQDAESTKKKKKAKLAKSNKYSDFLDLNLRAKRMCVKSWICNSSALHGKLTA